MACFAVHVFWILVFVSMLQSSNAQGGNNVAINISAYIRQADAQAERVAQPLRITTAKPDLTTTAELSLIQRILSKTENTIAAGILVAVALIVLLLCCIVCFLAAEEEEEDDEKPKRKKGAPPPPPQVNTEQPQQEDENQNSNKGEEYTWLGSYQKSPSYRTVDQLH